MVPTTSFFHLKELDYPQTSHLTFSHNSLIDSLFLGTIIKGLERRVAAIQPLLDLFIFSNDTNSVGHKTQRTIGGHVSSISIRHFPPLLHVLHILRA